MIATILGCGSSGKEWVRRGMVVGSNDCGKWGRPVDVLVLANSIHKFGDRIKTIKKHEGEVFATTQKYWKEVFPRVQGIKYTAFVSHIRKGMIYSARTTPIICCSLAIKLGATELILYGVDMLNHKVFARGTKRGNHEIATYVNFFKACEKIGVKVFLGATGTAFDNNLPLYEVCHHHPA